MVVDQRARKMGAQFSKDFLTRQLPFDPDLRARLTPSYPFGCKRVLLSDDFYSAISLAHVALETRPIEYITKSGVQIKSEEVPFDTVIFATVFQAQNYFNHIEISDESGGNNISRDWRRDPLRPLQGVAVEDLPNFAMLYRLNTNLSHVSVMLMIEAQARYISAMVRVVQETADIGHSLAICPKPQAAAEYNDRLQAWLEKTFAHPECRSWYKADNGLVTNNWPGTAI
ncbi:hypothetical protein OEA41_010030 [Lepraria neglecta]|uniref:Uncharacterized protein n=1 Tax=Lepraria neglecta TaxID=209136 RepID=A0AAD9YWH9_9LECA|nr:hypothetical protein OEA41_010030 [Lepraria neglecta]